MDNKHPLFRRERCFSNEIMQVLDQAFEHKLHAIVSTCMLVSLADSLDRAFELTVGIDGMNIVGDGICVHVHKLRQL